MTDKTDSNPILVNTFGTKAPAASRFGVGAKNIADIREAARAFVTLTRNVRYRG